jgi:chloramphenicol O-acetyltransferase type A
MPFTTVDLETWPRREHYELFKGLDHPFFSVTAEVDLTDWLSALRAAGLPFYPSLVHRVTAAANAVEALRTRMRGDTVVIHDRIDVSFTVPWREELFNFCTVAFDPDLETFLARCEPAVQRARTAPHLLLDEAHRDDMIYVSSAPWFAFTGLTQVGDAKTGDSFPRVAWGKLVERDGRSTVALNIQLHHAVADGLHVARFFEHLQAGLAEPLTPRV